MIYEELITEIQKENLHLLENVNFESGSKGLIHDNVIGLSKNLKTTAEKSCVLAEELGHYHVNVGNILDTKNINNIKQERLGRLWAYNRLIGLMGIVKTFEAGCRNQYEMAQYLDVTEEFLLEALSAYQSKYGKFASVDNYIVYFIPHLAVIKKL